MKRFLLAATALTALTAAAQAADLPRRYAAPAPAYAAVPTFTWTGFYVGMNAGGAVSSDITARTTTPFGGSSSSSTSAGGFLVGGTVGYNHQLSPNFVVGIEGDIGYADIQARVRSSDPFGASTSRLGIDGYLGTIRGRIGYAMGQWLFYGTGGWAFAEGRASTTDTFTSPFPPFATTTTSTSASRDLQGYVVGGGVEYAVNNSLSLKGEYLYIDFDKQRVATPVATTTVRQDTHLLKLGVNYKFNAFGW